MTGKGLLYSDHALGHPFERGIRRADVKWLPAEEILKSESATNKHEAVCSRAGYLGKHEASVIFLERSTATLVITVMCVERGTL